MKKRPGRAAFLLIILFGKEGIKRFVIKAGTPRFFTFGKRPYLLNSAFAGAKELRNIGTYDRIEHMWTELCGHFRRSF